MIRYPYRLFILKDQVELIEAPSNGVLTLYYTRKGGMDFI